MSLAAAPLGEHPQDDSEGDTGTSAPADLIARYEAIHAHAELELELAGRGELERLEELGARWEQLTEGLPPRPPEQALPLLERAKLIHERTRIELYRVRERLLADLSVHTHARRAAEGYGGRPARRPKLDRRA